ncbi:MAG: dipicolinate synthase subunit B [Clostridia bacterium]|nr:dipicolinate synthase subunit B [Clostridia bacterium]
MSNIGFALTGSFCTFERAIEQMKNLTDAGHNVTPIMSYHAYNLDTKFGDAKDFIEKIESCCSCPVIHTIAQAEPIGPKKMFDVLLVEPCSGNTLAKLAAGIVDTPVLMAIKSHLRNARPVLIAVSTNDALGNSAKNIGALLNMKHVYFIPMGQDDMYRKPRSIVADFDMTEHALNAALEGVQLQPIIKMYD